MWQARSIGSVPMRQISRKDRPPSSSVLRIDQLRLAWSPPEWVVATSCSRSPVATTASWDLERDDVQADPTTLSGKAGTAGRDERRRRPFAAPGYWRQRVHKESA